MVILIGGTGYTGKTLIAQRLLEKYQYPYLSIDHLKMGLYRANMECGFTPYDSSDYIGEKMWPILKGIIMTNIENGQNIIIEGCYLLPQRINELSDDYLKQIISFYLGFSTNYIQKYFAAKIIGNRRVIEARDYENCLTTTDYISITQSQKELCAKNHAKYFEIDEDYEKEMTEIYNWIDHELKQKRV